MQPEGKVIIRVLHDYGKSILKNTANRNIEWEWKERDVPVFKHRVSCRSVVSAEE